MLAPKSIALLIAGVIIISTLFSVFQVTYPTGNPVLPPIKPNQYQLFQVQFQDKNLLGMSNTGFTPTGNATVNIEGYVYSANGSIVKPLGNSYLYAAVFPAETNYLTSGNGYFQITVLKYGHGTFAFQIPGYNPVYFKISLYGTSVYWLNITLTKAQKYTLSGTTVDAGGHTVPTANLTFTDFIQTFSAESSNSGDYSLSLYNGTYDITVNKNGFSPQPTPYTVTISGADKANFKLTLNPLSTPSYYVSGYVHNVKSVSIKGATVTASTINNTTQTNSSGYYKIEVPFGANIIMAYAAGYGYNYTQIYVMVNMTDINLTLTNNNPLGASGSGSISGTGLGGIPPGAVKNITGSLGNGTSTVNYGNNTTSGNGSGGGSGGTSGGTGGSTGGGSGGTGGGTTGGNGTTKPTMFLTGNVTNSNNSAPVADTYLYFYINVNGTYFYEGVMTNGTGFYSLGISYTGHYRFYVYSPLYENYTFSIWFNSSTVKNFTLTPVPGNTFKVSGKLVNGLDDQVIPGNVTVYAFGSMKPMLKAEANTSGLYSLYLIKGNYSMEATSPGFSQNWNNTTLHPLSGDLAKNFTLYPVSSLGSGTSLWGGGQGGGSTGIPGVSSSNVSSQLSNSSGGSSLATGTRMVNLTIRMVNATSGAGINLTEFDLFIKLNNVYYNYTGATNASGNATIALGYEGNYTLLAEMFYYYGKPVSLNITGNTQIVMDMYPRALENLNITLVNAYNLSSGGTVTVPVNTLDITNYKQSLYRPPTVVQLPGVGTVFNYTLPSGNYSFTYTNVNYVTHSFWANISHTYNNTTQHIRPYLVIVNSNASTSNLEYNISQLAPKTVTVPTNTAFERYYAGTNGVQYVFTAYLGGYNIGNLVADSSFSLTSSQPVKIIYLNITDHSSTVPRSSWNMDPVNSSTVMVLTSYNISNASGIYVYNLTSSYNLGNNLNVSMDGIVQLYTMAGSSSVLFSTYYASNQNTLYIGFRSTYGTLDSPTAQQLQVSTLTVHYYTSLFNLVSSSGGS